MSRTFSHLIVLALSLLAIQGCMSGKASNNLTPLALKREPLVKSYQEVGFNGSRYCTFSVIPASKALEKPRLSGLLEKQMLFALRNGFEARGYRFVEIDQSPDFIATVDGDSEYKEAYIPPQAVTVPVWIPGQTITSYGNTSGSVYANGGWGTYSGNYSSSTYVPGYATSETYTRPGYTVGWHFPSLSVHVFDTKALSKVWHGVATGTSNNSELSVSSQLVLASLLCRFPECGAVAQNYPRKLGRVGVTVNVLTIDGANYLPAITEVMPHSVAEKAGVKQYDLILNINGIEAGNKPLSDVFRLLEGEVGTPANMTLWRMNRRIEVQMVRAASP